MAKIERIEPTSLPGGLWLDGNEYASENVEEAAGVLSLSTGETEGYRVSEELDVGAITDVTSSKMEWTSTGDVEVDALTTTLEQGPAITNADGVDDGIAFSQAPNLPGDQTMMVWVNMQAFGFNDSKDGDWLVNMRTGKDSRMSFQHFYSIDNNSFRIGFWLSDNTLLGLNFNTSQPQLNRWYNLCFTFKAGELFRVYTDGVFVGSLSATLGPLNTATTMTLFYHDWTTISNGRRANAKMAHLKMWRRVLDQLEIQEQMYQDPDLSDPDLTHWWPLGNYGAQDLVGGLNGVVTGAATNIGESPHWREATSGQAIPGVSPGDNLTGKKLYMQQRLSRAVDTDPSPTLTNLYTEITTMDGDLRSLINGGLIRSAHTQNNTMIR